VGIHWWIGRCVGGNSHPTQVFVGSDTFSVLSVRSVVNAVCSSHRTQVFVLWAVSPCCFRSALVGLICLNAHLPLLAIISREDCHLRFVDVLCTCTPLQCRSRSAGRNGRICQAMIQQPPGADPSSAVSGEVRTAPSISISQAARRFSFFFQSLLVAMCLISCWLSAPCFLESLFTAAQVKEWGVFEAGPRHVSGRYPGKTGRVLQNVVPCVVAPSCMLCMPW
jgi:hypothetical protein